MSARGDDGGAGTWVGRPVPRKEDPRLLRGIGTYIDDVPEPRGTLHLAVLRSPYAHARIGAVDASEAEALEGVVAVVTGADIADLIPPFTADYERPGFKVSRRSVLATDKARFVGDGVALILAENAYVAEDALGLVLVDYEQLPAVSDIEDALKPDAPRVHEELADNVLVEGGHGTEGFNEVFEAADHVLRERFRVNRVAGVAMEPRGCLAVYEKSDDAVTLWTGTQVPPHAARRHCPLSRLAGEQGPRGGARRGRRFRPQDVSLPRGASRGRHGARIPMSRSNGSRIGSRIS